MVGLKSKRAKLKWSPDAETAFNDLKTKICKADLLYFMKPDGELTLYCDASDYCCGGVLMQNQAVDGVPQEVPLYFFSHSFNKTERRWSTTEKEMFAIVFGVRKLHPYIAARKVVVMSDHRSITFNDKVSASAKVERWKMTLSEYDLTFHHVAGVENVVADGLSRCIGKGNTEGETIEAEESNILMSICNEDDYLISDERKAAFHAVHNDISGHWGIAKTLAQLESKGIVWKNMRKDIAYLLRRCSCVRIKPQRPIHKGLKYHLNSEKPGEVIAMDTKSVSDQPDKLGYMYILHIIDCFSRYLVSIPLKRLDMEECRRALSDYFDREGDPRELICDSGTQFVNQDIRKLCLERNIEFCPTTPGSHEENGIVERVIRTISEQLDILRHAHPETPWSTLLQRTVRAYNTVEHSELGCSPANLVKGIFNRLSPPDDMTSRQDQQSYLDAARARIEEANRRVPATQQPVPLEPGQFILIPIDRAGKKTSTVLRNEGPFRVNKIMQDTIYYEHPVFQRELRVHCSRASRYYPREGEVPEQTYLDSQGADKYIVEEILDHAPHAAKVRAANLRLLVKYANYNAEWYKFDSELAKTVAFVRYTESHPELRSLVKARIEAI